MHPTTPTPQPPCMVNAMPVAIAQAFDAPAAGVCVAGVSFRARQQHREITAAGVRAGSAGLFQRAMFQRAAFQRAMFQRAMFQRGVCQHATFRAAISQFLPNLRADT